MDLSLITTIIILGLAMTALSWFAGSDAPYIPTKTKNLTNLLKKAGLKKNKNIK